jgi:hypothetical protein
MYAPDAYCEKLKSPMRAFATHQQRRLAARREGETGKSQGIHHMAAEAVKLRYAAD